MVVPNDNRHAAGIASDSGLAFTLEATVGRWLPDSSADSTLTVQAFADRDGVPRIPGPLLRVTSGTAVRVTVINSISDSTLVLHGIQGPAGRDSLVVPSGERREVTYVAGAPGTYLYWATTAGRSYRQRTGRDAQLTGAIVIDDPTTPRDTAERVFVLTTVDLLPDSAGTVRDDVFDQAINGLSWPYTEVARATAGDTVRWRWVNGSYLPHPMHLHGFHYRLRAKGDGTADTTYATGTEPMVVTELMRPGSTFRMDFVPTRAGRWLFHCHMLAHIVPFPERPDSVRIHDLHDPAQHARTAMSGLIMGIDVAPRAASVPPSATPATGTTTTAATAAAPTAQRHRLLAQEILGDSGRVRRRGFVLQRGEVPRADSVEIPGTTLLFQRGRRAEVTVVNRLTQATSVHWHGMELDPWYDGVAGWSGHGSQVSPMIAPGDSFTVSFTPPRAGTFIYHTHLEEEPQLHYGMFGAMLVLEPGERYDPVTDLTFVVGDVTTPGSQSATLNGRVRPDTMVLRGATPYRLRFINIMAVIPQDVVLQRDTIPLRWTPIAKDGADLPASRHIEREARLTFGVGETYDFRWSAPRTGDFTLLVTPSGPETDTLRLPIRVRP